MKMASAFVVALLGVLASCSQPAPKQIAHESDAAPAASSQDVGPLVTYAVRDGDVRDVINKIAEGTGAKVAISPEVKGRVTLSLNHVPWRDALAAVVKTLGFKTVWDGPETVRVVGEN